MVATQPEATRWHIVYDQLNTHQSESLVRWIAELSDIKEDLGENSRERHAGLDGKIRCLSL